MSLPLEVESGTDPHRVIPTQRQKSIYFHLPDASDHTRRRRNGVQQNSSGIPQVRGWDRRNAGIAENSDGLGLLFGTFFAVLHRRFEVLDAFAEALAEVC